MHVLMTRKIVRCRDAQCNTKELPQTNTLTPTFLCMNLNYTRLFTIYLEFEEKFKIMLKNIILILML